MDTQDRLDWRERIDSSFGMGPDAPLDVASVVATGRRTVRRRRIATGSGGALAALAIAGAVAMGVPGGSGAAPSDTQDWATDGSAPSDTSSGVPAPSGASTGGPIEPKGEVKILDRIESGEHSALRVRDQAGKEWFVVTDDEGNRMNLRKLSGDEDRMTLAELLEQLEAR